MFGAFDMRPSGLTGQPNSYKSNSIHLFRICEISFEPLSPVKHFTIHRVDHRFDENLWARKPQPQNETLISGFITYHGYEGIPV